jgi:hypothetical protein
MPRDEWRCFIGRTRECWAAYCVDVDVCATGSSPEDARARLDSVLERLCHALLAGEPAAGTMKRPSLLRTLRYQAARWRGAPLCYAFHKPPELLLGLA